MNEVVDTRLVKVPRPGHRRAAVRCALAVACWLLAGGTLPAQVRATYLYTLSNFEGRLAYSFGRVAVDAKRDESYAIYQSLIRIFNSSGMEVFSFGEDLDVGSIVDATIDDKGDIILLSYKDSSPLVTRCDFRGVPFATLEIKKLPEGLAFGPERLFFQNGLLYFVSLTTASVIVTDDGGTFRRHVDVFRFLEQNESKKSDIQLVGFSVDRDGSFYFTVPVLFRAFKLSPDGKVSSFGRSGSAPGRFGVVAGIVTDRRGRILIADKLKCVVMVFDQQFNFLTEFGYRGARPENLITPGELALDGRDRLYVTQGRNRGVSVFALTGD